MSFYLGTKLRQNCVEETLRNMQHKMHGLCGLYNMTCNKKPEQAATSIYHKTSCKQGSVAQQPDTERHY